MGAYYDDGRGRYGTGESYDWFQKYGEEVEVALSSDGLWSYDHVKDGIELLRYNGDEDSQKCCGIWRQDSAGICAEPLPGRRSLFRRLMLH